jgi:hypothetical protein
VDLAQGERAEVELTRMIERRNGKGEVDRDEQEELWKASVRAYTARRRGQMREAWQEYHQGQAARHRAVLECLIARHEQQAAKLSEGGGGR